VGRFDLKDLLEAVDEFGCTSRELLAWEFTLDEEAIEPAWRLALDEGLLRLVRNDPETGEAMHALTRKGSARLRHLRQRNSDP
jgi:hypothetical protein